MKQRQKVILDTASGKLIQTLFKQAVPPCIRVVENPKKIVHMHSYGGLSYFFHGLTEGVLRGTRCLRCESKIWLPPRVHCPDCWREMMWWKVNTEGARVYSYSVTHYPGAGFKGTAPCPLISLEVPNVCTNMMGYLAEFGEGEPYIGMPVRPVFRTKNPTWTILDLAWVPAD